MTPDEKKMQERKIRLMKIALILGAIVAFDILWYLNQILKALQK